MLGFTIEEDEARQAPKLRWLQDQKMLPLYTISEVSKAFKLVIPPNMVYLVQLLMAHFLPSADVFSTTTFSVTSSQYETALEDVTKVEAELICPSELRAHAFLAMGKFCLRDKTRAREHVSVFLRELKPKPIGVGNAVAVTGNSSLVAPMSTLQTSTSAPTFSTPFTGALTATVDPATLNRHSHSSPAVRSNALLVLGDLCVRYTQLVDRHVGSMAVCLQDDNPIVRRHALILLTQVGQRISLFYHSTSITCSLIHTYLPT